MRCSALGTLNRYFIPMHTVHMCFGYYRIYVYMYICMCVDGVRCATTNTEYIKTRNVCQTHWHRACAHKHTQYGHNGVAATDDEHDDDD